MDLIFTSNGNMVSDIDIIENSDISDHYLITGKFNYCVDLYDENSYRTQCEIKDTIDRVNKSIIYRMYLDPNSFRSNVTTSLKAQDLGNVTRCLTTVLLNFWQTLQSFTTQ